MFRKKDEQKEEIEALPVYSSKLYAQMQKFLKSNAFEISRYTFNDYGKATVAIDNISVTFNLNDPNSEFKDPKSGILYTMGKNVNSSYFASWKKGLGRFIIEDYIDRNLNDNLRKKYFIIKFKPYLILTRAVTKDEYYCNFEEFKKYNVLNIDITQVWNSLPGNMPENNTKTPDKIYGCVFKIEKNCDELKYVNWISHINPINKNVTGIYENLGKEVMETTEYVDPVKTDPSVNADNNIKINSLF